VTPEAQRRELQRRKAAKASEVNVLKASDSEVEEALDALNGQVRAQQARASSARQAAEAAAREAAEARRAERATAGELAALQADMKNVAVEAYVRGPGRSTQLAFEAKSLQEVAARQHYLRVTANAGADSADRLRAARQDLEVQRAAAETAEERAAARRRTVDGRLKDLKTAVAVKERVAVAVDERLERALAEAASIDALDQRLANEIKAQQARLASRIGQRAGNAPRASRSVGRVGAVNLTTVRGITVASEIAANLEGLLAAAEADGFTLGGGGYRSSDGQVAARRSNCGTSDYDIYEKPASSCSPPTARPGLSMHERGLAIDFTSGGSLISSRRSPAFSWLAANAARFGFHNLPEEPWHWSTNGN
jgi:peptidoglycan hydrolase CwlO-like protein